MQHVKYTGIVQKGKEYGRTLGFPTANIPFEGDASGIYAAIVCVADTEYRSVVYVNSRRNVLEAHLLDFDGNLYGTEIEIELIEKIRDDQQFKDADEAKWVIAGDIAAAKAYFNSH